MKFNIKDWAGNTCFSGKTFNEFDEAWEYIYETDPMPVDENDEPINPDYYSDYYVTESEPSNESI